MLKQELFSKAYAQKNAYFQAPIEIFIFSFIFCLEKLVHTEINLIKI